MFVGVLSCFAPNQKGLFRAIHFKRNSTLQNFAETCTAFFHAIPRSRLTIPSLSISQSHRQALTQYAVCTLRGFRLWVSDEKTLPTLPKMFLLLRYSYFTGTVDGVFRPDICAFGPQAQYLTSPPAYIFALLLFKCILPICNSLVHSLEKISTIQLNTAHSASLSIPSQFSMDVSLWLFVTHCW
jgi:hypothetical protein